MLKNAQYIYDNILKADGVRSTLDYCKKAQVGVDLSVRNLYKMRTPGAILTDKTVVPKYALVEKTKFNSYGKGWYGWQLLGHTTYIAELNEGATFGPHDTGYIIQRSSLNRSGVTMLSCVFDPGFTTVEDSGAVNTMSVRIIINSKCGVFLEENARIGQLIILDNEDCELYNGQFQNGATTSKLLTKEIKE